MAGPARIGDRFDASLRCKMQLSAQQPRVLKRRGGAIEFWLTMLLPSGTNVQNDTRRISGIGYLNLQNNKTLYLSFEVPWREYGRLRRCFAPDFL